jgi:hypothetical protein
MLIRCVICGKEFEAWKCNQKVCGEECRQVYKKNYNISMTRTDKHCDKNRIKQRMHSKDLVCQICGKIIPHMYEEHRKPRMHDECVMRECKAIYKEKGYLPRIWYQRMYARGYTYEELAEEIKNENN